MMSRGLSCSQLYRDAIEKLSSSNIANSPNEAAWILEHIAGLTRLMIHASPDQTVSDDDRQRVWECVERRASGEPIQYIIGSQEFWGMDFMVTKSVLIPRPETELLVSAVLSRMEHHSNPIIIDVGTGSGCLAVSLSAEMPQATVLAIDRCPRAIQTARHNAWYHGKHNQIQFCVGDLLLPLLSAHLVGKVTSVVANLPYIRDEEFATLSPEVREFEPTIALDGGPDGLIHYRRLLPEAEKILAPKGHLVLEVGQGQAHALCEEVRSGSDFHVTEMIHDSLGIQRVVCLERIG